MASEEFEDLLHKYKEKKRPLSELYADPPIDQLRKSKNRVNIIIKINTFFITQK